MCPNGVRTHGAEVREAAPLVVLKGQHRRVSPWKIRVLCVCALTQSHFPTQAMFTVSKLKHLGLWDFHVDGGTK